MRIVLDTNVLLMSIPSASPYRPIFNALLEGKIELAISNEILSEYLEILQAKASSGVAKTIGELLVHSRFVRKTDIYYRWNLITVDPDDNKFIDCAIAANVRYIVSNDKHFSVLKDIDFPPVHVLTADHFWVELKNS